MLSHDVHPEVIGCQRPGVASDLIKSILPVRSCMNLFSRLEYRYGVANTGSVDVRHSESID